MSLPLEIYTLLGIGAATGALIYWTYFKEKRAISRADSIVEEIRIPVPVPIFKKPSVSESPRIISKRNPITGSCNHCKKRTSLPFRCRFCEALFCGDHRLPENHVCDGL